MTSETHEERAFRSAVARSIVDEIGPLITYSKFKDRMEALGHRAFSHNAFDSIRDQVWPDWRESKRAAKQDRIVKTHSGALE
jgi:hypothetical protein